MKYIRRFHIVLFLWLLMLAGQAMSASSDLLQVYQWARTHDLQYRAAQSRFEAEAISKNIGMARSLPQLSYNYRWMRNEYESNQQTINLSGKSVIKFQECAESPDVLSCLVQGLLGVEITTANSTYTSSESNLTLTQVIFDPDVTAERAQGRAMALKAAAEMSMAERDLIMRTLDAYLEVLRANDDAGLAFRQLESIADQQKIVTRRYELGVGKETEVYDAQAAYDVQVMAYEALRTRQFIALYHLSQMTGMEILDVQPLSENLIVEMPEPVDIQSWVVMAIERNDGIKMAEALERVAYYDMRRHNTSRLPRVMVAANYNERELKGGQGFQPASTSTAFGVDVRLPLYHGGALHYARKQAAYRETEARDTLAMQKNRIETAVVSAMLTIKNEVERFYARKRAADSASRSMEITQRSYTEGGSSFLDLLQVQKHYYETQQQLSHARYDYIRRVFELKQLAGTLTINDVRDYNAWFQPY